MRRLKARVISTAMTFFWAVQAFAAEPKTEKIEVALDIPANPLLDQICVVANYLTIGAIICSFVFGGLWLLQKKDASDDEEDDNDEDEIVVEPIAETKAIETSPAEPSQIELKPEADPAPAPEVIIEEVPPNVETAPEAETKVEEKAPEEPAPAATKSEKAEKSGTAKKTRKSKKKE